MSLGFVMVRLRSPRQLWSGFRYIKFLSSFVEDVAEGVAEDVEGVDEEHDGYAGNECEERAIREEEVVVFLDHESP